MGTFTRRVYLSEHLDAEAIEATYDGSFDVSSITITCEDPGSGWGGEAG